MNRAERRGFKVQKKLLLSITSQHTHYRQHQRQRIASVRRWQEQLHHNCVPQTSNPQTIRLKATSTQPEEHNGHSHSHNSNNNNTMSVPASPASQYKAMTAAHGNDVVHTKTATGQHSYEQEELSAFTAHFNTVLASSPLVKHLLPIETTG